MTVREEPIKTPAAQRMQDFRFRLMPFFVWSAAALIVVAMLFVRSRSYEYIGLAQSMEYEVSTPTPGTLDTVLVDLFEDVQPGDLVAKLNDDQLRAGIETVNATIQQLTAQLFATKAELLATGDQDLASWTADLRRFQIDEEQRHLDTLALTARIEADQFEKERLDLEHSRQRQLLEAGLVSELDVDSTRLLYEQVRERIEENQVLLAQTREEHQAATARREQFERNLPQLPTEDHLLQPLREAISVETQRLKEIEIQRTALALRSPVVGQVSQILCRRGQSVVPGEPILAIAERSVREIVAYLDESDPRRIGANTPVVMASRTTPGAMAESVVLRVGAGVQQLPPRLWKNPAVPDFGRAVVIAAAPGMTLMPGEAVTVRFLADQ